MERAHIEPEAPAGAGIERMSLAGTCPGHRIERGPRRGNIPAFCWMTCGAFTELEGTLKPQAARLPPAMEWVCVNWRGHQANVADLQPTQVSRESQPVDAVSTRAGEGGTCAQ